MTNSMVFEARRSKTGRGADASGSSNSSTPSCRQRCLSSARPARPCLSATIAKISSRCQRRRFVASRVTGLRAFAEMHSQRVVDMRPHSPPFRPSRTSFFTTFSSLFSRTTIHLRLAFPFVPFPKTEINLPPNRITIATDYSAFPSSIVHRRSLSDSNDNIAISPF